MPVLKTPYPVLPVPPKNYDPRYMDLLANALRFFHNEIRNPGEIRGTTLTLTELPSSGVGLETGAIILVPGTRYLAIVLENEAWTDGLQATGYVGNVTTNV